MMAALREWITSIVVVTMLLSVAQTLIPEGAVRKISTFTGGLILLVALLQPILGADLSRLDLRLEPYEEAVQTRQEELEEARKSELADIIGARTAAYISDKADALGLSVTVQVITESGPDGIPVPASAEITGQPSEALAAYMEQELGIPRERQVWR